jgi:hypothetical protein
MMPVMPLRHRADEDREQDNAGRDEVTLPGPRAITHTERLPPEPGLHAYRVDWSVGVSARNR